MKKTKKQMKECKHGHVLAQVGVYTRPSGRRECRECRAEGHRRYHASETGREAKRRYLQSPAGKQAKQRQKIQQQPFGTLIYRMRQKSGELPGQRE